MGYKTRHADINRNHIPISAYHASAVWLQPELVLRFRVVTMGIETVARSHIRQPHICNVLWKGDAIGHSENAPLGELKNNAPLSPNIFI